MAVHLQGWMDRWGAFVATTSTSAEKDILIEDGGRCEPLLCVFLCPLIYTNVDFIFMALVMGHHSAATSIRFTGGAVHHPCPTTTPHVGDTGLGPRMSLGLSPGYLNPTTKGRKCPGLTDGFLVDQVAFRLSHGIGSDCLPNRLPLR